MRHATKAIVIVVLVVLGGLFLWGVTVRSAAGGTLPAASGSPSPSPTPTASLPPVVKPASTATVHRALKWRRVAVHEWRQWNRARSAFAERVVPFQRHSARRPARSESNVRWLDAGRGWKHDRGVYHARTAKLVYQMKHPGGSSNGVRWLPLARWVRWPEYALHALAGLIMNESSGRPKAVSPTNDHGLVQFNEPSWATTFGRVMKRSFFPHIYDPELNLRFALYVYHVVQHDSFHPAWNGDPAAAW